MTKLKSLLVGLSLCAIVLLTSNSFAQVSPVIYNAAGSSAMFNTFAFAARLSLPPVCGAHNWSKKNGAAVHDSRSAQIPDNKGNVWIVWDNSANPHAICAYTNVDSGVGNRAFFAVPQATIALATSDDGSAGDNLIPAPMPPDETLPDAVFQKLQGATFNVGMTDIRPEDAEFATNRALAPLTNDRSGLGYGPPPIGTPILSAFSSKSAIPVQFVLSGTDPISLLPQNIVYTTVSIGAAPVVVFVNKTDTGSGGLGSSVFNNVNRFVLAGVVNGTLTRTRDLAATSGLPALGLHAVLREPLSGTYNTFEFTVPRSLEIGSSQEIGVVPPGDNPLNQTYASGGSRQRAVGTGELVTEVGNITDSIGYAFWSFGNFAGVVNTAKYLTLDGVDPIRGSYIDGTFPTCPQPPCKGALTFPNIVNGTYPSWSVLRLVAKSPLSFQLKLLINAAINQSTNIPDFVPASQLTVFRSHYTQSGVPGANGHKGAEAGGDMGGAVYTIQADLDYIADTGFELTEQKQ